MPDIEYPVFKEIDGPWIALLILGIFIFISSLIAIIVLFILLRRHQKYVQVQNRSLALTNQSNELRHIPIQTIDRQASIYETQKMKLFVPSSIDDMIEQDFGEIHAHFTPHGGIQHLYQCYPRTSKAYF